MSPCCWARAGAAFGWTAAESVKGLTGGTARGPPEGSAGAAAAGLPTTAAAPALAPATPMSLSRFRLGNVHHQLYPEYLDDTPGPNCGDREPCLKERAVRTDERIESDNSVARFFLMVESGLR